MKKILISAAICSMLFTAGASANWITGEPSIMAVNGGEAAFHTSLSSAQRLDINLTSGTSGKADMIFSAEGYDDSLTLSSLAFFPSGQGGHRDWNERCDLYGFQSHCYASYQ